MRIGINLLAILPNMSGGIEFYVRNLLSALAETDADNDYYLFTNRDNYETFHAGNPRFNLIRLDVGARPQALRIAWEQLVLPVMATKYRIHVMHSPSYTFPVLTPVPGVVTICDMLYRVYPDSIGSTKLLFWRLLVPWSARKCRRVLTISDNSRQDIVKFLKVPQQKVIHTPLALDKSLGQAHAPDSSMIAAACRKYSISQPYLLQVGGVGLHKNALALIAALSILHRESDFEQLQLVITGNNYGARQQLEQEARNLNLEQFVRLPGYIAREDLPAIYAGASVYMSPSYFEGFGMTLLEAMAYGTPVVTSNRSSLPEVAGNAALIVDPDDLIALAAAAKRIMSEPQLREHLIRLGYQRLRDYSWEKTAQLTISAYTEAAKAQSHV